MVAFKFPLKYNTINPSAQWLRTHEFYYYLNIFTTVNAVIEIDRFLNILLL